MSIELYKRPSGIFHLRGTVQGQRVDQSTRTRSRSEAEAIKVKVAADLFKRAVYGERAVATFDDAVTSYIEADGSPDHLDAIMERIGHRKLSEINQAVVDKLAKEMKPTASASTRVRQIYTPILAVLNQAADAGLCDPPRLRKPKVAAGRTDYLTPQEVEDWLAALAPHLRRIVTFYVGTGCRATEGLSLIWRDVTLGERRAVFWETKGGYARGAALCDRVRKLLPERPDKSDAAVFLNSRDEPWHGYDAINLMLKRAKARRDRDIAKGSKSPALVSAHCHRFRHTWATWAYACTRDLTLLMSQGGWKSVSMVMRYTHVATDDLAEAVLQKGWRFGENGDGMGRSVSKAHKTRTSSKASRK